jgi:hypothetical protein
VIRAELDELRLPTAATSWRSRSARFRFGAPNRAQLWASITLAAVAMVAIVG